MPFKCNELCIGEIDINYPYKLNTQCHSLRIESYWSINWVPLVIFNQTFENLSISINLSNNTSGYNVKLINCKINRCYLKNNRPDHTIIQNCEVEYLELTGKYYYVSIVNNNKIKKLRFDKSLKLLEIEEV